MAEIRLHDTRSGELLALEPPAVKPAIGIYACGPTVYSRIHIGNARPFVVFSTLARFLRHEGYEVRLVVNVTDVNDKIYDAARAQGVPSEQLALEMTNGVLRRHRRAGPRPPGLRAARLRRRWVRSRTTSRR